MDMQGVRLNFLHEYNFLACHMKTGMDNQLKEEIIFNRLVLTNM